MDPRTRAMRDIADELEQRPANIPKDVLPELAALAHRIEKLAAHEFVQRLIWEDRDCGESNA
jgi:hypothetical protein